MMLLFEVISSRGFDDSDVNELTSNEKEWLRISSSNSQALSSKSHVIPSFCIRLIREVFVEWQRNIGQVQLYFDGASKGNPREAGAREVLLNLEEKTELKFAWVLSNATNNQAEALSLWQGLKISVSKGIRNLIIAGDTLVIIQKCLSLAKHENLIESKTSPILIRIMYLLKKIENYKIFHVKQANNQLADMQANIGATLEQGSI